MLLLLEHMAGILGEREKADSLSHAEVRALARTALHLKMPSALGIQREFRKGKQEWRQKRSRCYGLNHAYASQNP
jgi:hypothetical protein